MNVLILNTSEITGGAAVAANRLMKALSKSGVEVSMLVRDRKTSDPKVVSVNNSIIIKRLNEFRFAWERLIIFICNCFSKKNLFQVSIANTGTDISNHPLVQKADIIHLHWINQGFLSLSDIKKLIETGKPIVWTLHDLWPVTAICHYPDGCDLYMKRCHACPKIKANPIVDLASFVFEKKEEVGLSEIQFVGCSRWIMNEAMKGDKVKKARFTSIPNAIDVSIFKPMGKMLARKHLNLPENKYLLLFAAAKLSDSRKGVTYFKEACELLKDKYQDQLEIVLMGNSSEELIKMFPFKVNTLGYISDQESMVATYSAVDMFIIPSLEDNLPNTIMESMACGTPCVGFKTGGIPEMIDHLTNGYISKYKDSEDLKLGVEWVLQNQTVLRQACLEKVLTCYQESVVIQQYIKLYETLLGT